MTGARDSVPAAFQAAAARFAETIGLTSKRLLYEFLAYPGPNGVTLSGTVLPADTEWRHITGARSSSPDADLVYITTKWMGFHIVKHYYVMRQYKEASGVVCSFLQFCKREGALPASLSKQLDVALEVAEDAVQQLPAILRIMKQPCARNEAWARLYPLQPFPLCLVTCSATNRSTSSRHWPADEEQAQHSWLSFTSERSRVEIEELQALVDAIPRGLSIVSKDSGRMWQVTAVRPDNTVVFRAADGSGTQHEVPFSAKRAADVRPGMVMALTFVTLSDGTKYATDWGYIHPTYYAPVMDHVEVFGANHLVPLAPLAAAV